MATPPSTASDIRVEISSSRASSGVVVVAVEFDILKIGEGRKQSGSKHKCAPLSSSLYHTVQCPYCCRKLPGIAEISSPNHCKTGKGSGGKMTRKKKGDAIQEAKKSETTWSCGAKILIVCKLLQYSTVQ